MTERTFDTRPSRDSRNADFPVRTALSPQARPKTKLYAGPLSRLDQGAEGACVGFGWATELMSTPVRVHPPESGPTSTAEADADAFGRRIYNAAKKIDEWPGENYDGTSVLAGARVMKAIGYVTEYRWAANVGDVVDSLIQHGPVVLGIPWYESMYDTDAEGKVTIGGPVVGGHCITLTGYIHAWKKQGEHVRWRNSWGTEYGVAGDGYVSLTDLGKLLAGDPEYGAGEACVPIGRQYGPAIITGM